MERAMGPLRCQHYGLKQKIMWVSIQRNSSVPVRRARSNRTPSLTLYGPFNTCFIKNFPISSK